MKKGAKGDSRERIIWGNNISGYVAAGTIALILRQRSYENSVQNQIWDTFVSAPELDVVVDFFKTTIEYNSLVYQWINWTNVTLVGVLILSVITWIVTLWKIQNMDID